MRRVGTVVAVLLAGTLALPGCFQYRQHAFEVTPAGDCPDLSRGCAKTVWGLVWGAFYAGEPSAARCGDVGLQEVTVRDNVGFLLLTVVSVGLVSPRRVEWKCAAPAPQPGVIRPPGRPGATEGR